ncbi:TrkA N-terminal domain protein [Peptoniphilus sp. oral taxon 375 str. F0436]|uniref:potassium channel family protein n=1 Tax=Urinicoccus timonensis TaxID=2024205 RepID=UPI00021A2E2F|nr:TrkA family potassium uptake protein [Urinicoccus timonensis]EGS30497.1 TrkA N-terminal domain protein [Peptoniphilus sp. oral taxon 375 str. F0436]
MKSFIVMGCGRFGESCAKTLVELDNEVLVIDEDYDKIKNISNDVTTAIQCDIMDEMAMKEIGLSNFDVAIISIGSSLTAAIMGTMLAKEAGVKYILAKAPSLREGGILKKVGADKIIYPERDMAKRVAHNLTSKNILDFFQISPKYSMVEQKIHDDWVNLDLEELKIRKRYGVTVVAVERGGDIIVSPSSDLQLMEGDILVIIGSNEQINKIEKGHA